MNEEIIIRTPIDAALAAAELAEHMVAIRDLEMWPENRIIVGDHRIAAAHITEALAGFLLTSDTFA